MNIEALVAEYGSVMKSYGRSLGVGDRVIAIDHSGSADRRFSEIRNALTEQAETHAIELKAYDHMNQHLVREVEILSERIRQLEAERVPEGLALVPVETLQLIHCDVENAADWLSSAASALRNLQTYPKPKKEGSDEMAA